MFYWVLCMIRRKKLVQPLSWFFVLLVTITMPCFALNNSMAEILNAINKLETKSEPKCYATASRLEDFMFGTPLSDKARFTKNILQKQFIEKIWLQSSLLAIADKEEIVLSSHIIKATREIFDNKKDANQHWQLTFESGFTLTIHKEDKRQYASIAYSLRAILAVQQNNLLNFESTLYPLSENALEQLKDSLDFYTLAVLKIADNKAKVDSEQLITLENVASVWQALGDGSADKKIKLKTRYATIDPTSVKEIAKEKLSANAA